MIDPELQKQFDAINAKLDATFVAAEKTRKYIWWTIVVTLALVVIPALFLPFAIGSLMNTYSSALNF